MSILTDAITYPPDFFKCVSIVDHDADHTQVDCLLGLWGVSGGNRESVMSEAFHYWRQYYCDGEYTGHLEETNLTE